MHVRLNDRYHRVATIAEADAENSSQAAPHAIVHALWIEGSPDTTMCGKVESLDTKRMPKNRIVSCPHCLAAIKKVRQRNSRDGRIAAVERHILAIEENKREQIAAEEIAEAKQRGIERDAEYLRKLRECCGYIQNGTEEALTISQDDATRGWSIRIGDSLARSRGTDRSYHADGFYEVIDMAHAVEKQEN